MPPACPLSPNLSHYVPRPYYRFALPSQQGPNTIGGSESLLHHFDFGSGGGSGGGGGGTNLSRSSSVMIRHTAPSLSAKSSFHRRRVSRSTAPGLFSRCSEDSPPSFNIVPYQPNQPTQHNSLTQYNQTVDQLFKTATHPTFPTILVDPSTFL